MKQATFKITGISPYLMNSPKSMVRPADNIGTKKIPSPEDEAESKCYRLDGTGSQLYVPAIAIRSSLIDGGKGRRLGKSALRSILSGTVFNVEEKCPLIDPDTDEPITNYEVDVQRCVVQKQGVMRARPRLDRWATTVTFEYDEDFIREEHILETLGTAGKLQGLGDYRPSSPNGRGGPFGRYVAERVNGS